MNDNEPAGFEGNAFTPNDGDAQPEDNQSSRKPRFKTDWGEISEEEIQQAFQPDGSAHGGVDHWSSIPSVQDSVSSSDSPVDWENVSQWEKDRGGHYGPEKTDLLLWELKMVRLYDPLAVHKALSEWSETMTGGFDGDGDSVPEDSHEYRNEAVHWGIDLQVLRWRGHYQTVEITVESGEEDGVENTADRLEAERWSGGLHWLTPGEPVRIRTDRLEDVITDIQLHFSSLNYDPDRTEWRSD